jgi:hypothetical protein
MDSFALPFTLSYSGSCPQCRLMVPPLGEVSATFFDQGFVICSRCGHAVDLWEATLEKVMRAAGWAFSLAALGPRVTFLSFRLRANDAIEVDLTQHGVSKEGIVLGICYTPQGGNCLQLETHGNVPHRRFRSTKVSLYGVQMKTSEGVPIEEEFSGDNIHAMVVWAPVEDSGAPWLYLVDAFEALALGQLSQAIVPAHAATEISITPIVRSILQQHAAKEGVERFLKQELRFSSTLNVILPLICALIGAKPLREGIRRDLNSLRTLRNKFVHDGVLPREVNSKEVRKLLCAAVFGFEYGKYLNSCLCRTSG